MTGMDLCEKYYRDIVGPAIRAACPEAMGHLAAGLVGEGSECFGFDDQFSRDHDFGPRVCLWLTDSAAERYGDTLRSVLASLPDSFDGISYSLRTKEASDRSGVIRIGDFYEKYIGSRSGPVSWKQWITIPEEYLATCTNGKVFYDAEGEFSRIRSCLLSYYPEDVRIKKIAARAAVMAQAGQYNYLRCVRRNEPVAAFMAMHEFIKNGMSMIYLLNKRYMPYYKWAHRGMRALNILPETADMFSALVTDSPENAAERIEKICTLVLDELIRQSLCGPGDAYLLAHTDEITGRIKDPVIKALPLMFA